MVGGGSKNAILRQAVADIFNAETFSIKNSDFAAPLGCAISGAKKVLNISYEQAAEFFVQRAEGTSTMPQKDNALVYEKLLRRYSDLESRVK
jgi:sugar (pentulose or hexulose) kinase